MGHFDVVILGQGLAGTSLAWYLRWAGSRVLVLDREPNQTASKIAAGLMTPVTGQKLVLTWRHSKLWFAAVAFYRRVERETRSELFYPTSMVRLFKSQDEVGIFCHRRHCEEFDRIVRHPVPLVDAESFDAPLNGFEMFPAGRLDVSAYLRLSRQTFESEGAYRASDVDVSRDIVLEQDSVHLPRLGISARQMIFCQGIDAIGNPWFRDVRFKPAKGEILTLRIPGLLENRVIHRGVWLVPLGNDLFKAGATYDWLQIDTTPTTKGRSEIIGRLQEFLRLPFEVVAHEAAIRPVHRNQFPIVGLHPHHPQLGYMNGFGSKGTLQTPYLAQHLAAVLRDCDAVDPEVDVQRKMTWPSVTPDDSSGRQLDANTSCHVERSVNRPLTQQAQELVRQVLEVGEAAIDATAGNGHDTHFLAQHVGNSGEVIAFDIQQLALDVTSRRLSAANLQNVRLVNQDHGLMTNVIPLKRRGRIGAVMFNLGYLPGGDKSITTNPTSTREAILQAADLLRPAGVLTILAYTGHDGGAGEAATVSEVLGDLPRAQFVIRVIESNPGKKPGPKLFVVRRKPSET